MGSGTLPELFFGKYQPILRSYSENPWFLPILQLYNPFGNPSCPLLATEWYSFGCNALALYRLVRHISIASNITIFAADLLALKVS